MLSSLSVPCTLPVPSSSSVPFLPSADRYEPQYGDRLVSRVIDWDRGSKRSHRGKLNTTLVSIKFLFVTITKKNLSSFLVLHSNPGDVTVEIKLF